MSVKLQGRKDHSATVISFSPGLEEVILFGGCPEWPSDYKTDSDLSQIANTTVLRFGETQLLTFRCACAEWVTVVVVSVGQSVS